MSWFTDPIRPVSQWFGARFSGGYQGVTLTDGVRNEFLVDLNQLARPGSVHPTGNGIVVTEADLTYATVIPAPGSPAAVGSATGGTLAAATYYYKIVALVNGGTGVASTEVSYVATGSTSSVALTWAAVAGATGYQVWRGTATGVENVYYTVGNVLAFTDTGALTSGSGTVPTATAITIGGVSVAGATEAAPVSLAEGNTGVVVVTGYSGRVIIFFKNIEGDATHNY